MRCTSVEHIDLQSQADAVRQFFLALPNDPEGSVVELNGQAVARVLRVKRDGTGAINAGGQWSAAKNARRCALVERDIDGTMSPEEAIELELLQRQMLEERQRLAPVPLDDLRRLHQDLMAKAQQQADDCRS